MIVICPNCGTRYKMPEGMLLAGKRMRCAECDHRWVLPSVDEEEELARAQQALRETALQEAPQAVPEITAPPSDEPPSAVSEDTPDEPAPVADDEPEEQAPPRSRNILAWAIVLVLASALGLLAGAIWLERIDPARIPVVGGLLAGLQPAPSSLSLEMQARITPMANGKLLLEVEGEISNRASGPRTLAPLKASLSGPSGVVRRWTIAPPAAQLAGGASVRFSTTLADVPEGHHQVRILGN